MQVSANPPLSATPPPSIPTPPVPKTHTKLFIGFFGVIGFLILSSLAVLGYTFFATKPEDFLSEAVKKSLEAKSVVLSFSSNDKSFSVDGIFHDGDSPFSKISLSWDKIEGQVGNKFSGTMVLNSKEIYIQGTYSKLDEIILTLKSVIANLETLETYKLVYPILTGSKWLFISLPEEGGTGTITPTTSLANKEYEAVYKKFEEALIIHRFERGFKKDNESYTRIALGFDKQKLISAINSLKDTDLDIKVSQINTVVKFVESVDSWDGDLIDVLISDDKYVKEVMFRMPKVPGKTLDELISEGSREQEELSYLRNFTGQIEDLLEGKAERELVDIGTLRLSSYNNASSISKPTEIVGFEEVSAAATKELLPILGVILGGGLSPGEKPAIPQVPQNLNQSQPNSGSTLQYNLPSIAPGAPGSREWEEDFWKRWEEMGKKNEEMQKKVEESQKKFCEENPNLCN